MGLALTSLGQDQVLLSQTYQRQALGRKPRGNIVWTSYIPKKEIPETNKKSG